MELENLFKEAGYEVAILTKNGDREIFHFVISKKGFEKIFDIGKRTLVGDDFWKSKRELLRTLINNNIFFPENIVLDKAEIETFIDLNFPKQTPSEKAIRVLELINSKTSYDGEGIDVKYVELEGEEWWRHAFLKNIEEFMFYLEALNKMGYIEWQVETSDGFHDVKLTITGLDKIITFQQNKISKYCFIAMSFDNDLTDLYDKGIEPALLQTGFIPLIVKKEHIESDVTINDAILASIKKARFTIADFTRHKHGVYFEAGYALGRGQKVIYTCKQDDISKAHFDTRNYQHIVWSDYDDLKNQLINKIEAFIIE